MDDLTTKIGIPGGAGLLGIILGFFGLKSRLSRIENDARYEVTCDKIHEAVDTRLKGIENLGKESRNDIKELLRRSK